MLVYKLTSPSGKLYFGKTSKTIPERIKQHKLDRRQLIKKDKHLPRFYSAWQKYPIELWKQELVAEVNTKQEADDLEKQMIFENNTTNPTFGYNMARGGNGGDTGRNNDPDKRKQHSKFMKSFDKNSEFYKLRVATLLNTHKELRNNPERLLAKRKKMSDATPKGVKHWNHTGLWVVNFNKYETIEQAHLAEGVTRDSINTWCNNSDKIIKKSTLTGLSKDESRIGKTRREVGFYRVLIGDKKNED